MTSIQHYSNTADLAQAAADKVVEDLSAAIATYGNATWVIAGGSTPLAAYRILAAMPTDALDWSKVMIIIGDERCVPFDSPDSNWNQAEEALLRFLPLAESVKRPPTNLTAEEAADRYDAYMRQLPQNSDGSPRLDHVWLGVGEDGHTLSIFPNHPSFQAAESDRLVIAVHDSPKPPADRISLNFKALQGTASCLVLAAGAAKAEAISRALAGDTSLPVTRAVQTIEAAGGQVTWLLDAEARKHDD
jgi:6-phosphogluconolactonase